MSEETLASSFSGSKVLITGGLGLIGSTLARHLTAYCDHILLIDSLNPDFGGNLFNINKFRDKVVVNISDIRDTNGLYFLLKGVDFIFNLAGQTSHMDSMTAPFEDLEINCKAQLSLLEVCRKVNPKVRIVYASTRQIYGRPQYLPVDEKHPLKPVDVNGINKIAGESYHLLYHDVYGLRTTVLRLTNTYGPYMRIKDARQIFLGVWIRQLLTDQPFEVWGGQQRRDFTYVDDAVTAFMAAAQCQATIGGAFNVGGAEIVSLTQLADMCLETRPTGRYNIRDFPPERKAIDIGDYCTDDGAFRRVTGWHPDTRLQIGLQKTISFYDENLKHYI